MLNLPYQRNSVTHKVICHYSQRGAHLFNLLGISFLDQNRLFVVTDQLTHCFIILNQGSIITTMIKIMTGQIKVRGEENIHREKNT